MPKYIVNCIVGKEPTRVRNVPADSIDGARIKVLHYFAGHKVVIGVIEEQKDMTEADRARANQMERFLKGFGI